MAELEDYKERVLEEQNLTIMTSTEYGLGEKFNWEAGEQTTADGYSLWYLKEQGQNLDICENIYHYESGMIEALQELISEERNNTILLWDNDFADSIDWEELAEEMNLTFELEDEGEIIEQWKDSILPDVREEFEKDGVPDRPARKESFNNYTDGLCKSGTISEKMYNNICLPDYFETSNL